MTSADIIEGLLSGLEGQRLPKWVVGITQEYECVITHPWHSVQIAPKLVDTDRILIIVHHLVIYANQRDTFTI